MKYSQLAPLVIGYIRVQQSLVLTSVLRPLALQRATSGPGCVSAALASRDICKASLCGILYGLPQAGAQEGAGEVRGPCDSPLTRAVRLSLKCQCFGREDAWSSLWCVHPGDVVLVRPLPSRLAWPWRAGLSQVRCTPRLQRCPASDTAGVLGPGWNRSGLSRRGPGVGSADPASCGGEEEAQPCSAEGSRHS